MLFNFLYYFLYKFVLLFFGFFLILIYLNQNPPARPRLKIKTGRFRFFGSSSGLSSGTKTARACASGSGYRFGLVLRV